VLLDRAYSALDEAHLFLHSIGAVPRRPATSFRPSSSSGNPSSSSSPQYPGRSAKKYRRVRRRADGKIVVEAYRDRKVGSETEDTDTQDESSSDDGKDVEGYKYVDFFRDAEEMRGREWEEVSDMSGLLGDDEDWVWVRSAESDTAHRGNTCRAMERGGAERAKGDRGAGFETGYPGNSTESDDVFARGLRELSKTLEEVVSYEGRE
jgi:hypothetical protein